ncbi:hypothetical protein SMUL_1046 [Sulfurospirillum multivorans DSM 12446]|uniref:Uncharacterized protein n=1 Tax=Sulfurospirillum multivorans (strain DM 12446 / JCM 15788 / NBRC 109480) TaxID=1150621 RepID=A0AA86E1Z5_SULMK|nr:hypothetical protein SMUL_1046 [Sulfurospirillum multivorans DSM 12446]
MAFGFVFDGRSLNGSEPKVALFPKTQRQSHVIHVLIIDGGIIAQWFTCKNYLPNFGKMEG